jgi:retinol dehydrogenase-12
MNDELAGKVFLVTGATGGIGKAAALELARRGAALTIVGRDRTKGERVLSELQAGSGNSQIDLLLGDLSVQAGLRGVARAFKARHRRLDVLVNNAGGVFLQHELTSDGLERTFALNHVAYFLLTRELLGLLAATQGARVVNTTSYPRGPIARIDLDDIATRPSGNAGFRAYIQSKTANILFTRELARRLSGSGVTANCFHPGVVRTAFSLNNRGVGIRLVYLLAMPFSRSPERGAETLVWLATSPDAANHSGEFFLNGRVAQPSPHAADDEAARRLWELTEQLCEPANEGTE